ncbi:MAG: 3-hydroxyisobutyrate dehydrogenase-like beta-hydroxyacid dehydrogenase [Oleiphilaceae bacterium]|jgi:3-hydroxyisobutyrate dehydrogenase
MRKKIIFVGLGRMGYPMSGWLSKSFSLYVYNRSAEKTEQWLAEYQGQALKDIQSIPSDTQAIITCVGNDDDLRALYLGENGFVAKAPKGCLLIDHTTSSANIAQEINKSAIEKGSLWLDAPVSGGEQGAINGQLSIMCGGSTDAFNKAKSILEIYSKSLSHLGDAGAGQLTKMANQIAVAGVIEGLAEALHFAEQAGLDSTKVISAISQGAAQSWQMDNRAGTMIKNNYNHGFAVDLMRKDLGICLNEARRLKARLPVTAIIDQFYADVQNMGGNRWDTSSLLMRYKDKG